MSLLEVDSIDVVYRRNGVEVKAVAGASLRVERGQVAGLVGESGCGKSTMAKAVVGLLPIDAGSIRFNDTELVALTRRARPVAQRKLQMIFQDPYSSLNPRRRIADQITDALTLAARFTGNRKARIAELLERVHLPAGAARRYPHEFSGGQRQRLAIARALAAEPELIVADEAISALDASAQASIANLLVELTRELQMGLLFISHDLSVVRQVADEVNVMYLGTVVESGPTAGIWSHPAHPYTEALIRAVPAADGRGVLPDDLPGEVPNPASPPAGCRFHPRCPRRFEPCDSVVPEQWMPVVLPLLGPRAGAGRTVACHLYDERAARVGDYQ